MIVRNGQVFGSVLRARASAEAEPERSKAAPKPPTKAELQAQAEALGLSTDGTKADIQARIDDAGTTKEVGGDGDDDSDG